jgi:hypothetical protein
MPRRILKGLANGLIETFISRNNDVSGYWGIGQLYREALEHQQLETCLDLLGNCAQPNGPIGAAVILQYRSYVSARLARHQMSLADLVVAKIEIRFGTFGACQPPQDHTHGDPFLCRVYLRAHRGPTYSATRCGRAAPHDPFTESRSTRADAP